MKPKTKPLSTGDSESLRRWLASRTEPIYTVLTLMLETGCTQDEAVRLKRDSFDLRSETVRISGPSGRTLPISRALCQRLLSHLREWDSYSLGRLISEGGPGSQTKAIRRAFAQATHESIGRNTYSVHSLRVSFARRCFEESGGNLHVLQAAMGLRNILNAAAYAPRPDREEIQERIENILG